MSTKYQRAAELLWRRTPTAVVVRSLDGRGWEIGGSGLVVWDELAEPRSILDLVERLSGTYDGDSKVIYADVRATIDALLADGVVVEVP